MKNILFFAFYAILLVLCCACGKKKQVYGILSDRWKALPSEQQDSIYNFVKNNYLGERYEMDDPIYAVNADLYTQNYYKEFGPKSTISSTNPARDTTSKSVYFSSVELQGFLTDIDNACDTAYGIRVYFAKYPDDYHDKKLRNQRTIILRGVCENKDLAHYADEASGGRIVSRDFGDVCPPYCNINDLTVTYIDGEYRSTGVCSGCPQ